MSHPMRVRGLKLPCHYNDLVVLYVAPHAGAWIETNVEIIEDYRHIVSHPMRVRGLKHGNLADIWRIYLSHPMRVRGLKP